MTSVHPTLAPTTAINRKRARAVAAMNDATRSRAFALLRDAVQTLGCTGAAKRIIKTDCSKSLVPGAFHRSYVAQVINGHIALEKVPASFFISVINAFGQGRIDCPHLATDIAPATCKANAAITWVQVANTGWDRLDLWKACQKCPHSQTPTQTPTQTQTQTQTEKEPIP